MFFIFNIQKVGGVLFHRCDLTTRLLNYTDLKKNNKQNSFFDIRHKTTNNFKSTRDLKAEKWKSNYIS